MNYTTAVFLINNHARAIAVAYEATDNSPREIVKTLDPAIKIDDFVVVQSSTRHKMTVCKVMETDVDFDLESSTPMNWIVGKVDDEAFKLTLVQEQQAISAIKSAELRQKLDSLRDNLLKDHLGTIKALPLASMTGDVKAVEEPAT